MPTVNRAQFDLLKADLGCSFAAQAHAFGTRHGLAYDPKAYRQNANAPDETLLELLTFGFDVWPDDTDDHNDGEAALAPSAAIQARAANRNRPMRVLAASIAALAILCASSIDLVHPVEASNGPRFERLASEGASRIILDTTISVTAPTPLVPDDAA